MMDQLVSTAGSICSSIATEKLKEQAGYVINYKENLKEVKELHARLISKQKDVHSLVEAGERKGEKVLDQVEKWQDWASDTINEFEYDDGHELVMEMEALKAAEKCCLKLVPWNPKFRHRLSQRAKEKANLIQQRINEIDGLSQLTLSTGPVSLGSTREGDFYENLESRQNCVKQIMEALKNDNFNRIGIYGMGGAGKTTLVKEVARRADYEKLFKVVVEVKISRDPDIIQIQNGIAERIGLSFDSIRTPKERAYKLHERFIAIRKPPKKQSTTNEQGGKLLLILDDIWNRQDLHLLGIFYDLENDPGCKFVVTSREKDVCMQMGVSHPHVYEIGDLDTNEAELLFREKIGNTLQKDYEETMRMLLMKCSRLPLSINILADTLRNQDLSIWKDTVQELDKAGRGEVIGVLSKLYSILELSYNNINSYEKRIFFLLCCLFPQGSDILISNLMRYGMGLNLLQSVDSLSEAIKEVKNWASDLRSLSLLKEVDIYRGDIKIHDDVREAGKFIASKEHRFLFHAGTMPRWKKKKAYQKYVAITMVSNDKNNHKCLSGLDLPSLELLRLQGASDLCNNYFSGMQKIKVLDLTECTIYHFFPSTDEQLRSLRILLLEHCYLGDISWICRLTKLQVLSLKKSDIRSLPKEVSELINLKILDLSSCSALGDIPAGILSKLTQLEGLYMNDSFYNWEAEGCMSSLSELESCVSLQLLEISIRSIDQLPNGDLPIFAHCLSSFKINLGVARWYNVDTSSFDRYMQVNDVTVSDLMKNGWNAMLKKTQCLILDGLSSNGSSRRIIYGGKREQVHKSVHDLLYSDLQQLHLFKISGIEYVLLAINDCIKAIKVLKVEKCCNVKFVLSSTNNLDHDDAMVFSGLRELKLRDLESLLGLCEGISSGEEKGISIQTLFTRQVKFPSLEELELISLDKIEQLWDMETDEHFKMSFLKLKRMFITEMDGLKHVWSNEFTCHDEEERLDMSKLELLHITGCGSLGSICPPSVAINGLPYLRDLEIRDCCAMKQVISTTGVVANKSGDDEDSESYCFDTTTTPFPSLLSLTLRSMETVESFYEGSLNVEFSVLRMLELHDLPQFITFIKPAPGRSKVFATHDQDDDDVWDNMVNDYYDVDDDYSVDAKTLFISGKITFPSLQTLTTYGLNSIEQLWDTIIFPNLQRMELHSMPKLKRIWTYNSNTNEEEEPDSETCSDVMGSRSHGCNNCFPNLIMLVIDKCPLIKSVFSSISLPSAYVLLNQLESLHIRFCNSLQQVIIISMEEKWLQSDDVVESQDVLYVEDNNSKNVLFSRLSSLELEHLCSLVCFYQGDRRMKIEFPALQKLVMTKLDEFETFVKLVGPYTVSDVGDDDIVSYYDTTPRVRSNSSNSLLFNEQFEFPSLEELKIKEISRPEGIFADDASATSIPTFPRLKTLNLSKCPKLAGLILAETSNSSSNRKVLENLQELVIEDCELLEELVFDVEHKSSNSNSSSISMLIMPRLVRLKVSRLDKLKRIPFDMFPSVQSVEINDCPLKSIKFLIRIETRSPPSPSPSFVLLLPRLEQLKIIGGCDDLEAIVGVEDQILTSIDRSCSSAPWSGMILKIPFINEIELVDLLLQAFICSTITICEVHLPCLKRIKVSRCCAMNSFSSGDLIAPELTVAIIDERYSNSDEDLSVILKHNFEDKYKDWPTKTQHDLHMHEYYGHKLYANKITGTYICEVCKQKGSGWLYRCYSGVRDTDTVCHFKVHPKCVLDESKVNNIDMSGMRDIPQDWPEETQHVMHVAFHQLRLTTERPGICNICWQTIFLLSYTCDGCYFHSHPECALDKQRLLQPPEGGIEET